METLLNENDNKLIKTLVIAFAVFHFIYLFFLTNYDLRERLFMSISYTLIFYITLYLAYSMGKFFTFYKLDN